MKETIKVAGSIALKSLAKWSLIVFLGCFITLITFLISFLWNIDLLFVDDQTFSGYFNDLLHQNITALILIFGAPLFVVVYVIMAKKVSIQNIIYLLIQSQAGDYATSAIVTAAEKITQKKGWHSELIDKGVLKVKMLQAAKDDPKTSQIQRSILRYGFKKINLDDVDFQQEDLQLSTLLVEKFKLFFTETVKPSLFFFWMLILLQMVLMIASLILR